MFRGVVKENEHKSHLITADLKGKNLRWVMLKVAICKCNVV